MPEPEARRSRSHYRHMMAHARRIRVAAGTSHDEAILCRFASLFSGQAVKSRILALH